MDDLSDRINALLSDPESMEKIKNLAGMLGGSGVLGGDFGGGQKGDAPRPDASRSDNDAPRSDAPRSGAPPEHHSGSGEEPIIDPAMLLKITSALRAVQKEDPRVDLLLALKKNLSESRQKKVDEAIHILRLLSLVPVLREQGIF